ncbi:hypothetical protein [Trichlorobacter lovleyi]|uniref:hypothetical protein n=1 Tax=Trichlorobacter lovleyi TaxID=313985 RepID=UPI0023F1812F|nr:hypothetical protein [Trichlorobacter lovleyi]
MKRVAVITCLMVVLNIVSAFAAGAGKAELEKWAKGVKLAGYSYGGVDQTDPGVFMAGWMSSKGDVLGVHMHPVSVFKGMQQQVVNKKKPEPFTYKGMQALYSNALGPGQIWIKYEKSGKVLSISQMDQSMAKGLSKSELIKLLDVMKPELFLK